MLQAGAASPCIQKLSLPCSPPAVLQAVVGHHLPSLPMDAIKQAVSPFWVTSSLCSGHTTWTCRLLQPKSTHPYCIPLAAVLCAMHPWCKYTRNGTPQLTVMSGSLLQSSVDWLCKAAVTGGAELHSVPRQSQKPGVCPTAQPSALRVPLPWCQAEY